MAQILIQFTIDCDDEYGYDDVMPDAEVPEDKLMAHHVVEGFKKDYGTDKREMINDFGMLDLREVEIHVTVIQPEQLPTRAVWR